MFISPIGFKPDMVPPALQFVIWMNPVTYLIEMYRACMIYGQFPGAVVILIYLVMCTGTFALGSAFFRKFKLIIVDFE
jgi:lipopolysaccharide transport system permease protein